MNIKEIRQQFFDKVEEKRAYCCVKIDSFLVSGYKTIKDNRQIDIYGGWISSSIFDEKNYLEHIIEAIKKHYAENWHVSIYNEKK